MSEAWRTEPGWLQGPVIRVKVQHSGPGSRKPIPHVLSPCELPSAGQATVSEGAAAPLAWTAAEELGQEPQRRRWGPGKGLGLGLRKGLGRGCYPGCPCSWPEIISLSPY